jgi:hypothetical protein
LPAFEHRDSSANYFFDAAGAASGNLRFRKANELIR